jgi:chromosome partitioning protein
MEKTLHDEDFEHYGAILRHEEGVDLIPSSIGTVGYGNEASKRHEPRVYPAELSGAYQHNYDHVLIRLPPIPVQLTINALAAADSGLSLFRHSICLLRA